jgi:hypothetical protein
LQHEARVFSRFLARVPATPYVTARYVDAHRATQTLGPVDRFDRWMVAVARVSPVLTRLADAYARLFLPRGVLRKKLVTLLAILETSTPFHRALDRAPGRHPAVVVMLLAVSGVGGILAALAGTLIFGPLHIRARIGGSRA